MTSLFPSVGSDGESLVYNARFPQEGADFALISTDGIALRLPLYALQACSPVFREMLSANNAPTIDQRCAHLPDIVATALDIFGSALLRMESPLRPDHDHRYPESTAWEHIDEALEFCVKYECVNIGSQILSDNLFAIAPQFLKASFFWAAKVRDRRIATAILFRGHEAVNAVNRGNNLPDSFIAPFGWAGFGAWTPDQAELVGTSWIMALCYAFARINEDQTWEDVRSPEAFRSMALWSELAGFFSHYLDLCEKHNAARPSFDPHRPGFLSEAMRLR